MKRRALACVLCALAVVAAFALAGCTGSSESYKPESKAAEVSTPTIGKDGVLRVGVDTSNPPMAGQSTSIIGIDVDIAAALADQLGLKLQVVDVKSDYAKALSDGTVDLVMGIDSTEATDGVWMSDVYLPTSIALFSTNSTAKAPASGDSVKIGAQISSMSSWTVTNEFGSGVLITETDLASAFKDLASGTVDYVASDAIVGTYSAHSAGIDVYIAALLQEAGGYCVGVSSTNTSLQTVVTNKMKTLTSNGVIKIIEKKWLGTTIDLSSVSLTAGAKSATANASSTNTNTTNTSSAVSSGDIAGNAVSATAVTNTAA